MTLTDTTRQRPTRQIQTQPYTEASLWQVAVLLISLLVLLPVGSIITLALRFDDNIWPHLIGSVLFGKANWWIWTSMAVGLALLILGLTVRLPLLWQKSAILCGAILSIVALAQIPGAVPQTLTLMAGVGIIALILGTSTAWLVTMYQFPGRRLFDWLLLVPLAMPTYIIAFCYVEILDYSGNLQTGLRELFSWRNAADYWFPEIRSLGGAIFVMACVLYPYVYLTARASFLQQSICVLEVARTLGRSGLSTFWTVGLPLARPALAAGVALALMECLNDIGAVEFFGVNTLTVSVYSTWLERSSLTGAAQIASVMLIFVVILFLVERKARRGRSFHHTTGRYRTISEERLSGVKGWLATATCAMPIILGFIVPVSVLIETAITFSSDAMSEGFWQATRNSLILSASAALLATCLGLILAYSRRVAPTALIKPAFRITGLGYAIPGTVLAVGLLIPLAALDNGLDNLMRNYFGFSSGLILSGTMFAIILAYTIRFLSISNGTIEAGLKKVSQNLDSASRSLGATAYQTLWRVHFPMLRPILATAALLVFVDSMKELPATLLLRPFDFETLATHVYNFASLEEFEEAGVAALTIVLIGLAPVIILSRTIMASRPGTSRSLLGDKSDKCSCTRPHDNGD